MLQADERRVRRRAGGRLKKRDTRGNDGWIAALVHYAAATYHWGFEDIMWKVPLSAIALLKRREAVNEKGDMTIMPLSVIEEIDDGEKANT